MYGMPVIPVILKTTNTWKFWMKYNKYPLKCIAEIKLSKSEREAKRKAKSKW